MIEGLVLLDKPAGPTSHDVVAGVRAALGGVRAGHTGTLDPAATGLLAIVTGRATRLIRYLPHEPKTYTGRFVLGVTTATDDLTGAILTRTDGPPPPPDEVTDAAAALAGKVTQVPPSVSAKRVEGKRLYKLARQGRPRLAAPVEVTVDRFAVMPTVDPAVFAYELVVSSGTYVRACVRDLGRSLGCGASVETLRRTSIGPWNVGAALPWPARTDDLRSAFIGLDTLPLALAHVDVGDPKEASLFSAGTVIPFSRGPVEAQPVAVHAPGGGLLGIGEVREGTLRPRVVLGDIAHPEPV